MPLVTLAALTLVAATWNFVSPLAALIAIAAYFFFLAPLPPKHVPARSLPLSGVRTGAYCNAQLPEIVDTIIDGQRTLDGQFRAAVERFGSAPCMGTRRHLGEKQVQRTIKTGDGRDAEKTFIVVQKQRAVTWQTFAEVYAEVRALGAALADSGLQAGTPLSLYSETRSEWQKTAQACFAFNFPVVTAYASLGEDALVFSFNQTKSTHVVTNAKLLPMLFKCLEHNRTSKVSAEE